MTTIPVVNVILDQNQNPIAVIEIPSPVLIIDISSSTLTIQI